MNKFEITPDTVCKWIIDSEACLTPTQLNELERQLTKTINRYCLPRPTYNDGTPIQFGDIVQIKNYIGKRSVERINYRGSGKCYVEGFRPENISHVEPDSWEKLEEDAKLSTCAYFGVTGKPRDACCPNFDNVSGNCPLDKTQDIIRRAKRLAGVCND